MRVLHAFRGEHPLREGGAERWVSEHEVAAAKAAVRQVLALHDQALAPSTVAFVENTIGALSAAYPISKGTEQDVSLKIAAYVGALTEYPPDLLAAAARRALQRCRFFPTVAELLGAGEDDSIDSKLSDRIYYRNRMSRALGIADWHHPEGTSAKASFFSVMSRRIETDERWGSQ